MRVLFICGSLELGKDGVGDYTRRLSSELMKQGNYVEVIAINDKYLPMPWQGYQVAEEIYIPTLRLPASDSWSSRLQIAKKAIDGFNPDWISLQYVPFSFNNKGLTFRLSNWLKEVGKGKKWHIMFHELWVGMDRQSTNKNKFWGAIQRYLIKTMLTTLQPKVVHTQTKLYLQLLHELGCKAVYLPLFGNIQVMKKSFPKEESNVQKTINLVLFGAIHPNAPIKQFSEEASLFSLETGYKVCLTFIGRNGSEIENWRNEWISKGLSESFLGEHTPEMISAILQSANFGVVTTPAALLEKSGSVAAMLEHGLPVICVSKNWESRYDFTPRQQSNIHIYTAGNLKAIFQEKSIISNPLTLHLVAEQFVSDLN